MPSFQISNKPPEKVKLKKAPQLRKTNQNKGKPKITEKRSTISLSDISGQDKHLGSDEYKTLYKNPDIIIHFYDTNTQRPYLSLDNVRISHDGRWGVKWCPDYDNPNLWVLLEYENRIDVNDFGELQRLWFIPYHNNVNVWYFENEDEWKVLQGICQVICDKLHIDHNLNRDKEYKDYIDNLPQLIKDEPIEIEKPKERKSFSDGKPVSIDLDW